MTLRIAAGLFLVLAAMLMLAALATETTASARKDSGIGFERAEERWQIVSMSVAGTNVRIVADGYEASWSPTGTRVAFRSLPSSDLLIAERSSGVVRQVASGAYGRPTWSPKGRRLAFQVGNSFSVDDEGLAVVNADGTGFRRLTTGDDSTPAWSPDGRRIAFVRFTDGGYYTLMTINADGTRPRKVTDDAYNAFTPAWSPDGRRIAFDAEPGNDIYVVDPDGANLVNLTRTAKPIDENPSWSPDGRVIAFESRPSSTRGAIAIHTIRVMGPDTGISPRRVGSTLIQFGARTDDASPSLVRVMATSISTP